jgi:hypothetical protein
MKHVTAKAADYAALGRRLDEVVFGHDAAGLQEALLDSAAWANSEIEWLRLNQPRPCYEEVHALWSAAMAKYAEGYSAMEAAMHPYNDAETKRGMAVIDEGDEIVRQATEARQTTSCRR